MHDHCKAIETIYVWKKNPNLTSPCSIGPLFYIGANSHEKQTCVCSKSLCVKVLIEMFVKFSHE